MKRKVKMNPLPENTALLIIDVQKGFDDPQHWGPRNNPQAEENIATLLELWRERNRPVFHIQHLSRDPQSPLRPGQIGCEFKDVVKPLANEPVIQKEVNSAFIGTNLQELLEEKGFKTLLMVGLTTNHCVSTTTRMAGNFGYETYVVADATATFDRIGPDGRTHKAEDVHSISLANLHQEFATVLNTADILDYWGL
jgi:nicotinamidase-related amidase